MFMAVHAWYARPFFGVRRSEIHFLQLNRAVRVIFLYNSSVCHDGRGPCRELTDWDAE
jgi:hypothetical protein